MRTACACLAAVCCIAGLTEAGRQKQQASQDERILAAFAAVWWNESSGRMNPPPGDSGRAVGPLQMWPIRVDDANRLAGRKRWTYEDRNDLGKSFEMFVVCCRHYHPMGTIEDLCRAWNGSPSRGPTQRSTAGYGAKAMDFLRRASAG